MIIELNTKSCQSCYKCIRECPLKAIEFKDNAAQVIPSECVLCGRCVLCCPQNAKIIQDEREDVKELIASGKRVCLSIAPSWVGWWRGISFPQLSEALKKLGFWAVEETAIGAAEVSREYGVLMRQGQMKNIIATACHSVVMLVERHYPELIKMLSPVSSPMMAHAKLMRESYGDIKVVFVGPCLSKMEEAADPLAGGMVNNALTFDSLSEWMAATGVTIAAEDPDAVGFTHAIARRYPEPTGILKTLSPADTAGYIPVAVDGIAKCVSLFEAIQREESEGLFIEANLCSGGCVNGPVMRLRGINNVLATACLQNGEQPFDKKVAESAKLQSTYPRVFQNRKKSVPEPSEEEIQKVLASTGKLRPEDQLNCSSCGYPTCRDKAKAVLLGKADLSMCMPYLMQRAETVSSTVLSHSPNAIFALDEDLCVLDLNPKAEEIYKVQRATALGQFLPAFYGESGFEDAKETGKLIEKKTFVDEIGKTVEKSIIYLRENRMYLLFVKDISQEERQKEKLEAIRSRTVQTAQKVIDKQMRVAQEIASLLGETTAETKVALTRLKGSLTESEEGEG